MAWSRYDEDPLLMGDETDSATDVDTDSLFDSSDDDETDTTSSVDTGIPSEIDDDDSDSDDASLFDDEVQHPPEHYLTKAANLDVQRLRQQRYDPKTQNRLDWVKDHCIQYCTFIKQDLSRCFQV
ncbi:hypothetical protein V8E51_012136 [Hyaloscypha variabilis]